jgi:hypothetical protein
MSYVEKLADFLVLLLPIFPLTILGTIEGGLAYSAVQLRRCYTALQTLQLLGMSMIAVGAMKSRVGSNVYRLIV